MPDRADPAPRCRSGAAADLVDADELAGDAEPTTCAISLPGARTLSAEWHLRPSAKIIGVVRTPSHAGESEPAVSGPSSAHNQCYAH